MPVRRCCCCYCHWWCCYCHWWCCYCHQPPLEAQGRTPPERRCSSDGAVAQSPPPPPRRCRCCCCWCPCYCSCHCCCYCYCRRSPPSSNVALPPGHTPAPPPPSPCRSAALPPPPPGPKPRRRCHSPKGGTDIFATELRRCQRQLEGAAPAAGRWRRPLHRQHREVRHPAAAGRGRGRQAVPMPEGSLRTHTRASKHKQAATQSVLPYVELGCVLHTERGELMGRRAVRQIRPPPHTHTHTGGIAAASSYCVRPAPIS